MAAMYAAGGDDKMPPGAKNSDDDLTNEMLRLELSNSTSKKKPPRRHTQKTSRPTWSGPTKQSVFVFLFQGETVYSVRNNAGEYGVPGGKRDPVDRGIWEAARREFREETGTDMPSGRYSYFEWGNNYHSIRIYYRNIASEEALLLPVGATSDPDGEEVETLWSSWDVSVRKGFRTHIAQAFAIYETVL